MTEQDFPSNITPRSSLPSPQSNAVRCETEKEREVKCFRFEDLAGEQTLVHIELHGTTYTLRRTRAGGLILNK